MYNSKERKKNVTVTIQFNYSLGSWLKMDLSNVGFIFDLSVITSNALRARGLERLGDIILFSRNELMQGAGIPSEVLTSLSIKDNERAYYLGADKARKGFTPAAMKEIDAVLRKLGLKFRGE